MLEIETSGYQKLLVFDDSQNLHWSMKHIKDFKITYSIVWVLKLFQDGQRKTIEF